MPESARSIAHALLALLLTTFLAAGAAPEARCDDLDDVLGGFDDDLGEERATPPAADDEERFWDLTGSISLGTKPLPHPASGPTTAGSSG